MRLHQNSTKMKKKKDKIETKITKCYLVECVIGNTNKYYKDELCVTNYQDAKKIKERMIKEAEEFLNKE